MYLDCQWPWGPAKAVQSLPTPFKRLLSSTVLPFHLSQVSGTQWDGWAALYLTMYFLSDSVGTLRWWKFKSISKWFIIQWEIQKQQRYWICCFPCFLSKIISGKEHFLLAFFFSSCFLFQVSPRYFQWKMDSWMMAVGISLFTVVWVRLTASLTRMEKEWSDTLARCLWVACLLTLMKVCLERAVHSTVPRLAHSR